MYDSQKSRKFLPLIHSLFHVLLPKAQTVWDELSAVDDRKLEGTEDCQNACGGQDPYNDTVKFPTTAGDGALEGNDSTDGGPKEDSDVVSALQSDSSHSPHMTLALAATAP
jgi:hypothetical protein